MKIYIGHSKEFDYENELYQPIRHSQLNNEHEITLAHEGATDRVTKDIIRASDVMIAEVSFPSTGLGIELAWADSLGCPIICMYCKGSTVSASLKAVSDTFIEYADANDMIDKITSELKTKGEYFLPR